MPAWSSQLPEPRTYAEIRLIRVPTGGLLQGIITSEEVLGCPTHWDNFRTQPCDGPDCELCKKGKPSRWQGYISLFNQLNGHQCVVQLTDLAAQQLDQFRRRYGHIRGLLAAFSRVAKRPNARIQVETRELPTPVPNLPGAVDIKAYMAMIWQTEGALE